MKLIDSEDIIKATRFKGLGGDSAARILMLMLKLNKINKLYARHADKKGVEFIDAALEELEIKVDVSDDELKRIPKEGPFIVVANHPYGGLEGMILIKYLCLVRPDFKVMANFLLQRIESLKDQIIPVNPFESRNEVRSSLAGMKAAFTHLKEGKCLGILPAGEVSTYYEGTTGIMDKQWQDFAIKLIKKAEVPVVPLYFHGTNSRLFHLLGMIHPLLRTVKIPSELFNKKNKSIRVRIGNPISVKDQAEVTDVSRYGRFLRSKVYALGTALEVKKFFTIGARRAPKIEDIIDPVPLDVLEKEIEQIKETYHLFKMQEYSVYCAPTRLIPNILNELGRLREITFREVGEGTNRKLDIDEYDLYYNQLFIWDDIERRIVGAYRVGKGHEILSEYGINGFYLQSLFKINKAFAPLLDQSLELGRSFIVKEYQRKPMPLFMLWKGILYFLIKHPEYRYLVGPVSISNRFSNFSKSMIISYIYQHHYNHEFAKLIKPRTAFVPQTGNVDIQVMFEGKPDINKLDKAIKDVETEGFRMPVLLKKYLQLNGKIISFNIDPLFNDALDGLLMLDLYDVPMDIITSLSKEIEDESLLDRFGLKESSILNYPHTIIDK
jgi:putative hemolysin